MKIYRIAKWNEVFERSDTRKLKVLSWVAIPTSFSSHGYQSMLDEFGEDAAAVYGAWCALVCIAASCTVRGTLANSRGIPLPVTHLVRMSGFPQPVFEKLIEWASRPGIGWLEEIDHVSPKENTDFYTEKQQSGKSPDDLPTISHRPDEIPRLPDQTRPDQTKPNPTTTDQTRPDPTRPDPPSVVSRQSVVVVMEKFDFAKARLLANKLLRFHEQTLGTPLIWQFACVASLFDEAMATDLIGTLKGDSIRSPSRYVRGVIRKACAERGVSQADLLASFPQAPATKPATKQKATVGE